MNYIEYKREWRKRNPEKVKIISDRFRKNNPANIILNGIKQRCNNKNNNAYKSYGGRGIKCLITLNEIKYLMKIDNYTTLERPTIHRKKNNRHYILENCEFIELSKNIKEANKINIKKYGKPVIQTSKEGKIINKFESIGKASKITGIDSTKISRVARGIKNFKTAGGFVWRFTNENLYLQL